MLEPSKKINVYLETGQTRVFAGALDWPGWCRIGRDEAAALQALFDYGPRYARAMRSTRLGFAAPTEMAALAVVERLPGGSATDFGVPERTPAVDAAPVALDDLRRLMALLRACWKALDAAAENAATAMAGGHELRKGPRGGGRDLDKLVQHVREAEAAYVRKLGGQPEALPGLDPATALRENRKATLRALEHAVEGKFPAVGPRGGKRWTPRYFVRRAAWHLLDHAWEIEDRVLP